MANQRADVFWAMARINGADPPAIINSLNVQGVVRNGLGDWTVTLLEGIEPENAVYIVTPEADSEEASVLPLSDTTVQVFGAGNDITFNLLVLRNGPEAG